MLVFYLSMLETDAERQSFSELYARIKRKCFYVAFQITRNKASAEDVVHNAFIKVIEQKEKIFALPCHKQDSYIVIITKNKAIDNVRAIRPTDDVFNEFGEEIIADSYDMSSDFESVEAYERLKELIQTLPLIYRVVFEMRYLQDLSNGEIAEALDVTKETVATRIKRAKQKLAKLVEEGSEGL